MATRVRSRFLRWKIWLAAAVAILALGGAGEYFLVQAALRGALMRADPDEIPTDPELARFALASAGSAYRQNCAACHGDRMQGDKQKGVPGLVEHHFLYGEGRVAEIERTILYGIRAGNAKTRHLADMPGFARAVPYDRYEISPLEPGEVRDLVEYLVRAGGKPADNSAAERGARVFGGKGQCFDCHEADGRGDAAIGAPNLTGPEWLYGAGTREDLYDSIAGGRRGSCPAWFKSLSPVMIRSLAVLVYTAAHDRP
jgi:cytochrome c oxidase cbb3-type subunit 3